MRRARRRRFVGVRTEVAVVGGGSVVGCAVEEEEELEEGGVRGDCASWAEAWVRRNMVGESVRRMKERRLLLRLFIAEVRGLFGGLGVGVGCEVRSGEVA